MSELVEAALWFGLVVGGIALVSMCIGLWEKAEDEEYRRQMRREREERERESS